MLGGVSGPGLRSPDPDGIFRANRKSLIAVIPIFQRFRSNLQPVLSTWVWDGSPAQTQVDEQTSCAPKSCPGVGREEQEPRDARPRSELRLAARPSPPHLGLLWEKMRAGEAG